MNDEYSRDENAALLEAVRLLGNGRAAEAKVIVDRFLIDRPENSTAYRTQAMLFTHASDYAAAASALSEAIRCSSNLNHSHYLELGEALLRGGRVPEAIEKLSIAIQSMEAAGDDWELSVAVFARAYANFRLGRFSAALNDLDKSEEGAHFDGEYWDVARLRDEIRDRSAKRQF